MSEFSIAIIEDVLPDIEDFIKLIARKSTSAEITTRLKKAEDAAKSLRIILNVEKQNLKTINDAEVQRI